VLLVGLGKRNTAERVTEGLELRGKTALVTGCSSGIGFETMRVLALRGARVLGVARSEAKAARACALVLDSATTGTAVPLPCDHENLESVVACTDAVRAAETTIDVLVCNAGILQRQVEQIDGIEKHFFVNHLSHFVLVTRLLDLLKAAPQGRVVVVGSSTGFLSAPEAGIDFNSIRGTDQAKPGEMYGQSKLANALFARELARRLSGTSVTANVVHPGVVATPMNRWQDLSWYHRVRSRAVRWRHGYGWSVKSVQEGAATTCYVATSPDIAEVSGSYFEDCGVAIPGVHMRDDAMAATLWSVSEELAEPYLQLASARATA